MKRKVIKIDEEKCNGCGRCIPNCPEGAIQVIDEKARLISDRFCDGLGACLGHCPEGAITIEEREAEAYDEARVMENIVKQGPNTIKAHLEHLKEHNEKVLLQEAIEFLKEKEIEIPQEFQSAAPAAACSTFTGCPGSQSRSFTKVEPAAEGDEQGERPSQLTHWPVQLHLISPNVPQYQEKDLLVAADCTAFSLGDFHKHYLKEKSLVIACPKLDEGQEVYEEKLVMLIDEAKVNTITVMIMQVPCCRGLLALVQRALEKANRKVPVKLVVVGVQGQILQDDWI